MDPERLRTLAGKANTAAETAVSGQVAHGVQTSCDGLPGSSLQWAAHQISQQLEPQVTAFVDSAHGLADHVAGAARDYRMTDEDAAVALNKAWPPK